MKKIFALLAIMTLCLTVLTACGGDEPASTVFSSTTEPAAVSSKSVKEESEEEYYNQDLDITNGTGVAILEMYISPADDEYWGEDMLGGDVFPTDETMHFSTELVGTVDATWDIKIVDEDGDEVVFEGVDFSSSVELVLHWGADGVTPTVTMN